MTFVKIVATIHLGVVQSPRLLVDGEYRVSLTTWTAKGIGPMKSFLKKAWKVFEKFAIVFSFVVTLVLVLVLAGASLVGYQTLATVPIPESAEALRDDVVCKTIIDIDAMVEDLDNAVIVRTIHINQTIPVVFDLPLDKSLSVALTDNVPLNRPTTFNLPSNGGKINGTVSLNLPSGYELPIHLNMTVPVSQSLPVEMDVPVEIPLKETDLGPVTAKLKSLVQPYTGFLSLQLGCIEP